MAENESIVPAAEGTSRRSLLAKAAAAGAVVYAAPVVSSIPAYAAGGLPSCNSASGTLCVWFSPNQNGGFGTWHADVLPLSGESPNGPVPVLTVSPTVGGSTRSVRFSGNPNNIPGNLGANLATDTYTYYGGGARIESLDPACAVEIQALVCRPQSGWDDPDTADKTKVCRPTNEKAPPASWAVGSSLTPINQAGAPNGDVGGGKFQDAYYHTGRTGEGEGERCKLGILFTVCCS